MGKRPVTRHWYINRYHWRRVFATYCHEKWRCVGSERNVALPVRYACLIYYFHLVPFQPAGHPAQGSIAQIRPCRHLSAHCRQLFSYHAGQPTRSGLLGLGNIQFCMAVCIHRNHSLLLQTERTQLSGNNLLHSDGMQHLCCLQTFMQSCTFLIYLLAHCRRCLIHHRRRILLLPQITLYAFCFPPLCIRWDNLPHDSIVVHFITSLSSTSYPFWKTYFYFLIEKFSEMLYLCSCSMKVKLTVLKRECCENRRQYPLL